MPNTNSRSPARWATRLVAMLSVLALGCWSLPGTAASGLGVEAKIADLVVRPDPGLGLSVPPVNPNNYNVISTVRIGVVRLGIHWR